ncbi:type IV toxin-antitoxin system AbiEi family antitoxin domain-containing protein [Rhodococcus fascians]|nr:type IV toxin-antitoxin system AbiEi family antitoxin domain-containing protein [Rhodococcus fascians]
MLNDVLSGQDGVITGAQAMACGLSRQQIERRVRSGSWERKAPNVYFVCDREFGDRARVRCAVWGSGAGAAASGMTAAFWLDLEPRLSGILEVTTPRCGRSHALPGTRVRRRDLPFSDVIVRKGVRVTAIALTVLEAAVSTAGGVGVMDRALGRHTSIDALRAAHARNSGRRGSAAAGRLLKAAEGGARSEAERIVVRLLTDAGITGWVANFRYGSFVIDIAFPAVRLAIEIDGWAFHSDATAFQNDRHRQNELSRDWTVLRYTWADLVERPESVLAQIRCRIPH